MRAPPWCAHGADPPLSCCLRRVRHAHVRVHRALALLTCPAPWPSLCRAARSTSARARSARSCARWGRACGMHGSGRGHGLFCWMRRLREGAARCCLWPLLLPVAARTLRLRRHSAGPEKPPARCPLSYPRPSLWLRSCAAAPSPRAWQPTRCARAAAGVLPPHRIARGHCAAPARAPHALAALRGCARAFPKRDPASILASSAPHPSLPAPAPPQVRTCYESVVWHYEWAAEPTPAQLKDACDEVRVGLGACVRGFDTLPCSRQPILLNAPPPHLFACTPAPGRGRVVLPRAHHLFRAGAQPGRGLPRLAARQEAEVL